MDFPFSIGSRGHAVADLQRKLACLDANESPELAAFQQVSLDCLLSGVYDEITAAAVRAFKRRHGLHPDDALCTEEAWQELNVQTGSVFNEVWQYEIDGLRGETVPAAVTPARDDLVHKAHASKLAGLAFSGGGIRSATFNLGILQALAEMRLLRHVDYLSTVSGGGYIGAWFSRWLAREGGDIAVLERALTPGARGMQDEADEIKWLRQFANHLSTRTGFFSADRWMVAAIYVLNTTLNMAILLALLAALMVLPRLCAILSVRWGEDAVGGLVIVAVACLLWSVMMLTYHLAVRPGRRNTGLLFGRGQASVVMFIVVPLIIAGMCGSVALWNGRHAFTAIVQRSNALWWLVSPGLVYFMAWNSGWTLAQWRNARLRRQAEPMHVHMHALLRNAMSRLMCAVVALALGAVAVLWTARRLADVDDALPRDEQNSMTLAVVAFGMPVVLTLFGLTMIVYVGLLGRQHSDQSRAWWSRQSGAAVLGVAFWVALATVSLYAPGLLAWAQGHAGAWAGALLAGGWLGTTLAGLLVGNRDTDALPKGRSRLNVLATVAPLVFSVGLMCALSALLHHVLAESDLAIEITDKTALLPVLRAFDAQTLHMSPETLCAAMLALTLVGVLLAWRVDINKFSLHMIHRNQLVRAFLGASNRGRTQDRYTGFNEDDDIPMAALLRKKFTGDGMQRPYHIINTTLNLVKGDEAAWAARKAAGFAFTPAFCGFELPRRAVPGGARRSHEAMRGCFRPVTLYAAPGMALTGEDDGVMLGMAMATSGAAASPGTGFHVSQPLVFLMTLFNLRMGCWFANPRNLVSRPRRTRTVSDRSVPAETYRAPRPPRMSPPLGIRHSLQELFGLNDARSRFLYLSDGGQFDNLGVFELVRRRCHLIVAVDAAPDAQFNFSDLGNAIRKCATDLNIEIEIDVGKIEPHPTSNFSHSHCAVGRIRYDKVDEGGAIGTILYIKPSMLGSEYAHILSYRKINKGFPHQSTADARFDEAQFENYRSLGYSIGKIALASAVDTARSDVGTASRDAPGGCVDMSLLCAALHVAWGAPG